MYDVIPCVVAGLIIDAFGELRDQQEQVKEDMEVRADLMLTHNHLWSAIFDIFLVFFKVLVVLSTTKHRIVFISSGLLIANS